MSFAAHSPPNNCLEMPPHLYADHVQEVFSYSVAQLDYLFQFSSLADIDKQCLRDTLVAAAMLHDIGKLDEGNQPVLKSGNGRLAVDHVDAGTAIAQRMGNELLGWLIRGHHAPGLPSRKVEKYFIKYFNKRAR